MANQKSVEDVQREFSRLEAEYQHTRSYTEALIARQAEQLETARREQEAAQDRLQRFLAANAGTVFTLVTQVEAPKSGVIAELKRLNNRKDEYQDGN